MTPVEDRILMEVLKYIPSYSSFYFYELVSKADKGIQWEHSMNKDAMTDSNVMNFLINEGFAVVRNDINSGARHDVLELTERGRRLKLWGSPAGFYNEQSREDEDKEFRKRMDKTLLKLNKWIAIATIATGIAAIVQIVQFIIDNTTCC